MKKAALASMQRQNGFAAPADDEKTPAALQGILSIALPDSLARARLPLALQDSLARCRTSWALPGNEAAGLPRQRGSAASTGAKAAPATARR